MERKWTRDEVVQHAAPAARVWLDRPPRALRYWWFYTVTGEWLSSVVIATVLVLGLGLDLVSGARQRG